MRHASNNMVTIDDFEHQLASNGLSLLKASQLTNVSRTTLKNICDGQKVRYVTATRVVNSLRSQGFNIVFHGQRDIDPHSTLHTLSVTQLPGTKRSKSPCDIVSEATELAEELDQKIQELIKHHYEKTDGIQRICTDKLAYYCNELHRHVHDLDELRRS